MIQYGNIGKDVRALQNKLNAAGYNCGPVDGIFGNITLGAVKRYQQANRLEVDGIVGPKTFASLYRDSFDTTPIRNNNPPSVGGNNAIVNEARKHLGFHEGSGNVNPYSKYFGRPPEAWCADFVSYVATKAGYKLNNASAQYLLDEVKNRGVWKGRNNPATGDVVGFAWDGRNGWADHVGIVEKVYFENGRKYIQTIEGNSSDAVRRKNYLADSAVIKGYGSLR